MTSIDRHSVVAATSRQVSADLSGGAVILDLDEGMYYELNDVGTVVWNLIRQRPCPVTELVAAIREEYEVEVARCEADVVELLGDMCDRGLVEIRDAASA